MFITKNRGNTQLRTSKATNKNDLLTQEQELLLKEFVVRLPKIRKRMKVSQTELGEKVGLSRQTISAIERGSIPLTWNNYLAILFYVYFNDKKVFYYPTNYEKDRYELLEKILKK